MIILKPIVSEKAYALSLKGTYVFRVPKHTTKYEIIDAVGRQYGVKVLSVRTIVMPSKTKRSGKKRVETRLSSWKKAYVVVEKGQELPVFKEVKE
jgi:large subunit ribosomal protein L23